MPLEERGDIGVLGGLPDQVGDVDGEEVARREEARDGLQIDMVGVEEVGLRPAERLHGIIGCGARLAGLGANDGMLAIGLVPDRDDFNAGLRRKNAGGKLGLGLVRKPVTHADGEPRQLQTLRHLSPREGTT